MSRPGALGIYSFTEVLFQSVSVYALDHNVNMYLHLESLNATIKEST